ncbi:hypothetical protein M501DRAFT_930548 [Patellaria atrata CBS 101060]|uniref:FCP1 homology domain-containing protein n=1 Tax=Patellaria atrata CBS 101060 TaxID=1346257 RepID=A0A9P4SDY7_9PEZI|nr:hypothetical protein M501DRAFT_930548 [Patellaria atrata CBS 101060]
MGIKEEKDAMEEDNNDVAQYNDEKIPLLDQREPEPFNAPQQSSRWLIPKRIASSFIGVVRMVLSMVVTPGRYVIACFYDEEGHFSTLMPIYNLNKKLFKKRRKTKNVIEDGKAMGRQRSQKSHESKSRMKRQSRRSPSVASTSTAVTSDSEHDSERPSTGDSKEQDTPSRNTRSKTGASSTSDEITPAKRSIRIKLHNDEVLKRKQRKSASGKTSNPTSSEQVSEEAAAALKSPINPVAAKATKYPRAPAPPRPLIPRRQPSYSNPTNPQGAGLPHQKTLIIDLDETLIHSMAKGGRYTTGHMVEVKLNQAVGAGGQVIGPQVPILYYVHKRPHCDEFLRKVSRWYNLIIFTASVQEYADPVIDWLELERKYFAGRYYRQHCTFRNGAYIKDLSQVEPDLSKVMILDNSPMSYIFHEDNAIPIEGWISDPTDNDLLNLIPLFEGLQYLTDVRALLALRLGQPQAV